MAVLRQREKALRRERRRLRSKRSFSGISPPFRLVVYRSLRHIYGQIVDDSKGVTLVASSSLEKEIPSRMEKPGTKMEESEMVGVVLAERAKKKKIKEVVFDRNGFLYHGRVKALADGARTGGLKF